MILLADTNLLVRLADTNSPQHALAQNAVARLAEAGHELVLVPQVLYEYWVVATRPETHNGLGRDVATARTDVADFLELFRLLRDERGIFGHWRELMTAYAVLGKLAHDARLVAAMQRHGFTHLLTFNADDFARFQEITVLTPAEIVSGVTPA